MRLAARWRRGPEVLALLARNARGGVERRPTQQQADHVCLYQSAIELRRAFSPPWKKVAMVLAADSLIRAARPRPAVRSAARVLSMPAAKSKRAGEACNNQTVEV